MISKNTLSLIIENVLNEIAKSELKIIYIYESDETSYSSYGSWEEKIIVFRYNKFEKNINIIGSYTNYFKYDYPLGYEEDDYSQYETEEYDLPAIKDKSLEDKVKWLIKYFKADVVIYSYDSETSYSWPHIIYPETEEEVYNLFGSKTELIEFFKVFKNKFSDSFQPIEKFINFNKGISGISKIGKDKTYRKKRTSKRKPIRRK